MLKDLLQQFRGLIGPKKPAGNEPAPESGKPKNTAEKAADAAKTQDRIVLGVLLAIGAVIYLFVMNLPEDVAEGESVIPLAQLTGQVGAQPRQETLEQQFRRENKNIPLSDGSSIPAHVVNERTRLFRQVPFGDKELTYEMRLPLNWGQSRFAEYGSPGKEKYAVLTNIDRFFGPAVEDNRPFVWLEVARLNRATVAQHFMDLFFIERGITPEAIKVQSPQKAEALYVDVRDYVTYAVRALFVMNGDRMVVLTFAVPLENYKTYKDLMGLTINSFKMLTKIDRQPEETLSYKLLNVLSFDYLKRWLPRNENRSSSLNPSVEFILPTELKLIKKEGEDIQIEGLIIVNGWRNTPTFNRSIIEQAITKRLAQGGLKLRDVLQPEKDLPVPEGMTKVTQAVYVGIVDQTPPTTEEFGLIQDDKSFPRQEVWVTILDNGDYTAAVTLVSWPQVKSYPHWANNVAAYQTIINSLKLRKLGF